MPSPSKRDTTPRSRRNDNSEMLLSVFVPRPEAPSQLTSGSLRASAALALLTTEPPVMGGVTRLVTVGLELPPSS